MKASLLNRLRHYFELNDLSLRDKKSGSMNHNYIMDTRSGPVVARQVRRDVPNQPMLEHERSVYNHLRLTGVDRTPNSLGYDPVFQLHVVTYIAGRDVKAGDLTRNQLGELIDTLSTIHRFEFDQPVRNTHPEPVRTIGLKRCRRIIEPDCPDPALRQWALSERTYQKSLKRTLLAARRGCPLQPGLRHGDLGGNLRLQGGSVYIIDWEAGHTGTGSELAHLSLHGNLSSDQLDFVLKRYARRMDRNVDRLRTMVELKRKLNAYNDAIWALMRYTILNKRGRTEQARTYHQLARKRVEHYRSLTE